MAIPKVRQRGQDFSESWLKYQVGGKTRWREFKFKPNSDYFYQWTFKIRARKQPKSQNENFCLFSLAMVKHRTRWHNKKVSPRNFIFIAFNLGRSSRPLRDRALKMTSGLTGFDLMTLKNLPLDIQEFTRIIDRNLI
ncbi:MAG: hypothetical protein LBR11_04460, partial [Deltaproteobacteria bacterium]|nr:hypothetical protein [Deltaproteobacteria bacterium]